MATHYSRRQFLKITGGGMLGLYVASHFGGFNQVAEAAIPGATLPPANATKYQTPMLIPPAMPGRAPQEARASKTRLDYYEISMKQFPQQILPAGTAGDHGLGLRRRGREPREERAADSTTLLRSPSRPKPDGRCG